MRRGAPRRIFVSMQIALTIAGSDSGGGAGIQADLKTFHQFGVFGTSVITALTAQNTLGVTDWSAVDPGMVRAQLAAVLADLRPAACKSGMLPNAQVIGVVAAAIREYRLHNYVLDPVMVATSGDVLVEDDAVAAIQRSLFPLAALATPNLDEAAVLLGEEISDESAMKAAARKLAGMGAKAVLLKGGHLAGSDSVVDVLFDGETTVFRHERIETSSTHGTGCTLSAAIAARLALGVQLREAVRTGIDFVHRAITEAPQLGSGHGPLNHFVSPEAKRTP
jgi:hydroxymethylpyrimidine/phosphomethylpyrimidine kinase